MARTNAQMPEFMTSPILGEFLVADLALLVETIEAHAAENGRGRVDAVRVRAVRAAAAQLAAWHSAADS